MHRSTHIRASGISMDVAKAAFLGYLSLQVFQPDPDKKAQT